MSNVVNDLIIKSPPWLLLFTLLFPSFLFLFQFSSFQKYGTLKKKSCSPEKKRKNINNEKSISQNRTGKFIRGKKKCSRQRAFFQNKISGQKRTVSPPRSLDFIIAKAVAEAAIASSTVVCRSSPSEIIPTNSCIWFS